MAHLWKGFNYALKNFYISVARSINEKKKAHNILPRMYVRFRFAFHKVLQVNIVNKSCWVWQGQSANILKTVYGS